MEEEGQESPEQNPAPEAPAPAEPESSSSSKPLTREEDRRQANERAVREVQAKASADEGDADEPKAPRERPVKQARRQREERSDAGEKPAEPALEPPPHWTSEEKRDFRESTPTQQRAALRLHESREADRAAFQREFGSTRELVETMRPFLEAMGETNLTPQEAIKKSLQLWSESRKDPAKFARDFASVHKLKATFEDGGEKKGEDSGGHEALKLVTTFLAEQRTKEDAQKFGTAYQRVCSAKNADGTDRFPDLDDNSPAGIEKAQRIGTLFRDAEFRQALKVLSPNITEEGILVQAYLHCGGRVQNAAPAGPPSQTHIARSRLAASSQPGRAAQVGQRPKVRLSRREANERALAELNSD